MNTALVTGASGFIGGHLVGSLHARGIHTKCLVRSTSARQRLEGSATELVAGDITDFPSLRRAVAGVDVVFHLAGKTCALRRAELFSVNAQGTELLAAACAAQPNPPTFVLVSSVAAAGPAPRDRPRTEDDSPQPVSQYGRSKLAGEAAARRFSPQMPVTIVRPGVVFGEFDPGMVIVAKSIKHAGLHLNAGFRSPRLSVIYVRDLIELLLVAAERGERCTADATGAGVYFAVRPEYPTFVELGRLMAPELRKNGRGPRTLCVPAPAAYVLAIINEGIAWYRGKPDIFSRDKLREGLVASWACSGAKIAEQFAFRPSAPLDEQLRTTARWYCEQGWA